MTRQLVGPYIWLRQVQLLVGADLPIQSLYTETGNIEQTLLLDRQILY